MKILFLVTGVGMGDSIRVNTIIDALKKDNPKSKFLIAAYANSYNYFKKKYPTINIAGYKIPGKAMKFKVLPFILSNFILPIFWFASAFRIKKAVKKFKPDIVVSDFEPIGAFLAKLVGKKCVMLFGFDPNLYEQYKKENKVGTIMALQAKYLEKNYSFGDFVIVPTLLGVKRGSLIYTYVNPIARKLPKELPTKKTLMKKLGFKKGPVLVMLGGSDFGIKLLNNLQRIAHAFPDETFVVFGTKKLVQPLPNLLHYTFKDNVLEYLKICKGMITLAGEVTLSEGVIFRKPMLIYPIQDHVEQTMNVYALRSVAMLGKNVKNLKSDIKKFLGDIGKLQKKMDALKVKPDGAKQVVTVVKTLLGR